MDKTRLLNSFPAFFIATVGSRVISIGLRASSPETGYLLSVQRGDSTPWKVVRVNEDMTTGKKIAEAVTVRTDNGALEAELTVVGVGDAASCSSRLEKRMHK